MTHHQTRGETALRVGGGDRPKIIMPIRKSYGSYTGDAQLDMKADFVIAWPSCERAWSARMQPSRYYKKTR